MFVPVHELGFEQIEHICGIERQLITFIGT